MHIELTSDVSSNSLILALRRCFSRRRTPSQIISDNFKTFKAVEIRNFIRFNRIQWEFILKRSPWWGWGVGGGWRGCGGVWRGVEGGEGL